MCVIHTTRGPRLMEFQISTEPKHDETHVVTRNNKLVLAHAKPSESRTVLSTPKPTAKPTPTSIHATRQTPSRSLPSSTLPNQFAVPDTMRLTSEILAATPSFLNPINDRELDLRGAFPKEQVLHF